MKLNKAIIVLTILFSLTLIIATASAADGTNNTSDILKEGIDSDNIVLENYAEESSNENTVITSSDDNALVENSSSESKTITIVADKKYPNQVLYPSVQPAIDEANPGDTIILKGTFIHCHFTIDKPLNIIASNAVLSPCPHHQSEGAGNYGVFYLTGGSSGTVIEGFTFTNADKASSPFSILIRGASNITVRDCTMNYYDPSADMYDGIFIENSNDISLSNLLVNNTYNGIVINGSSNVNVKNSIIVNNELNAIKVLENSKNVYISNNSIKKNGKVGINLESIDNVNVINNVIEDNGLLNYETGSGIYVNANITKLVVKGNLFLSNGLHAIMYDYRTRNLNNDKNANLLTIVDNNYFTGHSSMILHHRVYVESVNGGYSYDSENDVFVSDSNGNYTESKSYSYMLHAFVEADLICGYTYYTPKISWSMNQPGNNGKYDLNLYLSNISQIKKGVYQVSIVDADGNIANDLSSVDVTFYLNNYSTVDPNTNEVFKIVRIQNGTATVDFTDLKEEYLLTGNVVVAAFPGWSPFVSNNPLVQFNVADLDIPGVLTPTQIKSNDLNIVYQSSGIISAILSDVNGKLLSGKKIEIEVNGNKYRKVTDNQGKVTLQISLNAGTYYASIRFVGDDEYAVSSTKSKVVVSKATSKLDSSVLTTYPVSNSYFKAKLTDSNGKTLSNQKITLKINGKIISVKTDKSGIAKVKVSLTAKKTYLVSIKFAGNKNFKAISKTGKIIVKTGSKKSIIVSKNLKIKRNVKKLYSFKLKASNNKVLSKQKVTVKLNGKTYNIKTNSKGVAKLSIKLKKVKKYKINMRFLGNAQYKAVSKTCKITVNK